MRIKIGNIQLDKRSVIIIGAIVLGIVIAYFLVAPLFGQTHKIGGEVETLEREMSAARQAIQSEGKFQQTGKLLTRRKVSLAIDEITKIGAAQDINFLSISPQQIMKPNGSKYPVLPIRMDLQSEYNDLGLFFGALEKLEQSIIAVKDFQVEVDQDILPQIRTDLVVEVYLKEGEDG